MTPEFEKWAEEEGINLYFDTNHKDLMRPIGSACWSLWQARDAEVEALKARIAELENRCVVLETAAITIATTKDSLEHKLTELEAASVPDGWKLVPVEPTLSTLVAADKIDALEAELALLREGQEPVVYIKCETESDKVVGTTSLNVVRVERNDDGSLTAVTDHWPAPSSPVTKTVVMPEPFPIHSNPLSDWDAGYESGYNDALSLVEECLNRGQKK